MLYPVILPIRKCGEPHLLDADGAPLVAVHTWLVLTVITSVLPVVVTVLAGAGGQTCQY